MEKIQDHLGNTFLNEYEMCEKYGIGWSTYRQRIGPLGWSLEKALTTPVQRRQSNKSKETQKTEGTNKDEFVISSNYPSQEYVKYFKFKIAQLMHEQQKISNSEVHSAINDKIVNFGKVIKEVLNESFFYSIMDLLYAGKSDVAEKMCTRAVIQHCTFLLNNPTDMVKDIYVHFADDFHMQNKMVS